MNQHMKTHGLPARRGQGFRWPAPTQPAALALLGIMGGERD